MTAKRDRVTISREQFKRLCDDLISEVPAVLEARDRSDKKMDKQSALLKALYTRVQEKLGLPAEAITKTDFPTYAFAYRSALYQTLEDHSKERFDYGPIVEAFLKKASRQG